MSDSWIDHLPSTEREKIRKRMRSPEEYERLREKVRGPEDLEREMERNAEFAEARLTLESEPKAREAVRKSVMDYVHEHGIENVFESFPEDKEAALTNGAFEVVVTEVNRQPCLALKLQPSEKGNVSAPSGNVSEVFALKPALQQQILSSFRLK